MEQDIEKLKGLFYSNRLTQYGKRKLIEYYEKRIKELEENTILKKVNNISENVKIKDVTNFINKSLEDFNKEYIPASLVEEKVREVIELIESEQFKIIMGDTTKCNRIKYILKEELLERRK